MAAAFAGVSGGYSANLLIGPVDAVLAGISTEAAHLVDPERDVSVVANYYFIVMSTFLITLLGTIITEKVTLPALPKWQQDKPIARQTPLSGLHAAGLRNAGLVFAVSITLIAVGLIPDSGILRDPNTHSISQSAFMKGIVTVISLVAAMCGIAYGVTGENPTAVWLGVEQGFYRKHGLNVEAIYMRNGPLSMAAMAAGDVQMNFTSANNVLNAAAAGLDVVIVANVIGRGEGVFMARPEIHKPEDLKGKWVAIQSIGGGGWAYNMLALDYLQLDPESEHL